MSTSPDTAACYRPADAIALLVGLRVEDQLEALAGSCLLLDLQQRPAGDELAQLTPLLAQLPCPIMGVGAQTVPEALAINLDCVLDDEKCLPALCRNIANAPIAAMTLVQLSRAIEQLDVMAALDMESVTYASLQGGSEYQAWLREYRAEAWPAISGELPVLVTRDQDRLLITLNRPELRNSISVEVRDALVEALSLAAQDNCIKSVVLQGAGKCFSVGGELREFGSVPDTASGHLIRSLRLPGRWLARIASRCEARVHGACIGAGVELPAFAQRVVAKPNAYFQLPEIQFGLIPGAGGCVSIAKRIGRHRFNQLALSGKRINAELALEWGLVDAIDG
ncbi:MAG TPA: enoyl-CoA hydratase/isomerase family protein [Spongiibacteraceae bacterium]|nr:hypothetical protein [Spongiibacteraceae bacterium]HCS28465.1 enoyl-CoA hydratase/isomerase family protein [Spongiibacteraceae bacterium]